MELEFLRDIVLILGMAIVITFIFHKLRIPNIIGLLLTGVLVGPHGISVISNVHEVEILAEIGVILLLFTIGIEFSLKSLVKIRKILLIGGSFQVIVTIAIIYLISRQLDNPVNESIFIGFLIALSSTAIVLKLLQDKGEIDSLHGRTTLGILIFQDIFIVPLMLITPLLAGNTNAMGGSVLEIILKFAGVAVIVILGAKYLIPRVLYQVARTQSREMFLLTIIVLGFAVAFLTYSAGLSLALGAFLAGLVISESEYSQQALGNIIPFLHVFTSFFFISIGMLLDVSFLADNIILILLFTTLVLSVKTFLAGTATFLLGFPLRTAIIVGFTLSQVGEFSFLLSKIGMEEGLLSENNYQLFLSVSVLSMAATPFVIRLSNKISDFVYLFPLPEKIKYGFIPKPESTIAKIKDHVIIVGYGITGKNVARAAKYANIAHVIIEVNPDTVRMERDKGEIIYYGDATQEEVLSHANAEEAMIMVVTIPSTGDTKGIIQMARQLNPHLHLIIRSRFITDMQIMYDLGADEVIPEEFETSIEIFTRMLAKYLIPHDLIEKLVAEVRADGYQMFRSLSLEESSTPHLKVNIPEVEIHTIHVCEKAPMIGKDFNITAFTDKHKLTPLAISRGQQVISLPDKDFRFQTNDILFLLGPANKIPDILDLFRGSETDEIC